MAVCVACYKGGPGHRPCQFDWCTCPTCSDQAQTMFDVGPTGHVALKRRQP